jgi:hypothetical protein
MDTNSTILSLIVIILGFGAFFVSLEYRAERFRLRHREIMDGKYSKEYVKNLEDKLKARDDLINNDGSLTTEQEILDILDDAMHALDKLGDVLKLEDKIKEQQFEIKRLSDLVNNSKF